MNRKDAPKWSHLKKRLRPLNETELVALIKDLFDYSAENQTFLTARFIDKKEALEDYRQRILDQFDPDKDGFAELDLVEARKAIREYRKASNDLPGALDLMLTYVEAGTRFTNAFGDVHEGFYNSLESVLNEAIQLLKTPEGRGLYPNFCKRFLTLADDAEEIAWGYGDHVVYEIEALDDFMNER